MTKSSVMEPIRGSRLADASTGLSTAVLKESGSKQINVWCTARPALSKKERFLLKMSVSVSFRTDWIGLRMTGREVKRVA